MQGNISIVLHVCIRYAAKKFLRDLLIFHKRKPSLYGNFRTTISAST